MGILDGNQKNEPMHYGEVYGIWSYLLAAQSAFVENQVMVNHSGDKDLRKFLEDYNVNVLVPEIKELSELLKKNGIALPPAPPDRANANLEDIPVGARFMDPEIANARAHLITAGLIACSTIMGSSTREDIATMFSQFHTKKTKYGGMILKLLKNKGWIIVPPLYNSGSHQD
ncbi:DUF3231 family protein [Alkalibaculum sp. M08DMB]|uniref:DUF3231 family protein n=1 Tax=Alkalibaculum sporogenes TaxID=2655001 RepID=A0A6A7K4X7_9FIRM|nr:DUF3231 family protein [Alkalibaculum sporogenes]MPW24430.1 DUF3231 family protein [Alkalibaculum sporogenes]